MSVIRIIGNDRSVATLEFRSKLRRAADRRLIGGGDASKMMVSVQQKWDYAADTHTRAMRRLRLLSPRIATPPIRQLAYHKLFRQALDPELIHDVRAAVQTGTPLGNCRFRKQIERTLQCSTGHPRPGRPAKAEKGYCPLYLHRRPQRIIFRSGARKPASPPVPGAPGNIDLFCLLLYPLKE